MRLVSHVCTPSKAHTWEMTDSIETVDTTFVRPEEDKSDFTYLVKDAAEINSIVTEDSTFQLEADDFDGNIEAKFVEPKPLSKYLYFSYTIG